MKVFLKSNDSYASISDLEQYMKVVFAHITNMIRIEEVKVQKNELTNAHLDWDYAPNQLYGVMPANKNNTIPKGVLIEVKYGFQFDASDHSIVRDAIIKAISLRGELQFIQIEDGYSNTAKYWSTSNNAPTFSSPIHTKVNTSDAQQSSSSVNKAKTNDYMPGLKKGFLN